jgi:hypothetical protein
VVRLIKRATNVVQVVKHEISVILDIGIVIFLNYY